MSEGVVHDSFYNLLCLTANNQVDWYGCSGGNYCLRIQDWSHHVVWEVCVTVGKEQSFSHLQGGTYTIWSMVGGYEHLGGRCCFHLQGRIFTCCSLEYGCQLFRGTYCHKLQSRNFTLCSLVGGYQYFGGTCCSSNDITMCFGRWLACVTTNFCLQLQDITCVQHIAQ